MIWNKYDTTTNPKWAWSEAFIPKMSEQEKELQIQSSIETLGCSRKEAEIALDFTLRDEIWMNHYYQVNITYTPNPDKIKVAHLSIKNRKKTQIRDWRDLQQIKNDLVGPEFEGVEVFPKESNLVDTANQFHLWVVCDSEFCFPFGWHQGRKVTNMEDNGSRQRPNAAYEEVA